MKPLLDIRDLCVTYPGRGRRKDKVALDGVSVSIGAGETLGVVGESGSGKSTLGGCVLGLVRSNRGTVTFDERDITRASGRDRRALSTQIQAVFQDPYTSLNPHRTVEQSVGETLTNVTDLSRSERRHRVATMMERVGLDQTALAKFPAQFSGGQRQRIAIARALLPEPRLVVCDESVSALDLSVQAQVLNLLLELQRERGVAYVFITHDLSVVRHMSTKIAVLEQGRLVEFGAANQVTEHPTQPYTRRLITASPQADPDVQNARRATRRAMALLTSEAASDSHGAGVQVLHALEHQAVMEAVAQPGASTAILDQALAKFAAQPDDINRLIDLRSAIPELVARTGAQMVPEHVQSKVSDARHGLCGALVVSGDANEFAARCHALSVAIKAGDHSRARTLVHSLDRPEDLAAEHPRHGTNQAAAGPR